MFNLTIFSGISGLKYKSPIYISPSEIIIVEFSEQHSVYGIIPRLYGIIPTYKSRAYVSS